MIIVNLIGGLGNQMFQYAAGRALAAELSVPLRLDVSGFADYALHQGFELQRIFNCPAELASEHDVRRVLGWQLPLVFRLALSRLNMTMPKPRCWVAEPHFHYWSGIHKTLPESYLEGYWQSEKYFVDMAAQIREDFTFQLPMSDENADLSKHIAQVNAVSLHVRRGDYASNAKTTATHGLCSLDYYREAINHITKHVDQPYFFIFSDDITWVKENLELDFPCEFISNNQGQESYNDMRLMSLCQHHIIANSSFSWWGAWLNSRPNKIVVAPKSWFANEIHNAQDLIPDEWVRL